MKLVYHIFEGVLENISFKQRNPAQKKAAMTQMTRIFILLCGHRLIPMITCEADPSLMSYSWRYETHSR